MGQKPEGTPQPPQPPKFDRRLQFYMLQLIGVPLLLVLPILALFGVFGVSTATASDSSESLELEVRYLSRVRYGMTREMQVTVRNTSARSLPGVAVTFDKNYLEQFSQVSLTPGAEAVTDEVHRVSLGELPVGEARLVEVELRADAYGSHRGTVTAAAGATQTARVSVATMVYP